MPPDSGNAVSKERIRIPGLRACLAAPARSLQPALSRRSGEGFNPSRAPRYPGGLTSGT